MKKDPASRAKVHEVKTLLYAGHCNPPHRVIFLLTLADASTALRTLGHTRNPMSARRPLMVWCLTAPGLSLPALTNMRNPQPATQLLQSQSLGAARSDSQPHVMAHQGCTFCCRSRKESEESSDKTRTLSPQTLKPLKPEVSVNPSNPPNLKTQSVSDKTPAPQPVSPADGS